MSSSDETKSKSNPGQDGEGESSIQPSGNASKVPSPKPVMYTISNSRSSESSDLPASPDPKGNANDGFSSQTEHAIRASPAERLQIDRSFSENNLGETPMRGNLSGNHRHSYSLESVNSGELVLSDSNETPRAIDSELQAVTTEGNQLISPTSSLGDDSTVEGEDSDTDGSLEDDSEVLLAKEMALAITKNPNMTPDQLRQLQQQVQRKVEWKKKENAIQKAEKKKRRKMLKKSSISKEMKAAYKEARNNAKEAMKDAKAGAKQIRQEAKKGLRKAGLIKQSSIGGSVSTTSTDGGARQLPLSTNDLVLTHLPGASTVGTTTLEDDYDSEKIRLSSIIWKRRSGMGKYSITNSWERRRVVLKGTKLIYYKSLQESDGEYDEDDRSFSGHDSNPALAYGTSATTQNSNTDWIKNYIEDKTGVSIPWEVGASASAGARGYLDFKKEKASAGASYGHTGAPTPFALSIKVASATKYKFCFDTQQELMQWLAAITDVVVSGSVDAYNADILEANDPSAHGDPVAAIASSSGFGWQEASPKNAATSASGGGHQLWSTERYVVASANTIDSKALLEQEESGSSENFEAEVEELMGARPEDYVIDTSTADELLAIPAKFMEPAFFLMNAVILASRAETTLTNEMFWYVLVFFNVLGVMVVNKVQAGGAIKLKPNLENGITTESKLKSKKSISKRKSAPGLPTILSGESHDSSVKSVASNLVEDNFVPPAGSSSMRIENPEDVPMKDGTIFAGWRQVEPSSMLVRGCGYKANKTKVPCPNSLYECVELDVFESRARVPDMAGRVILPPTNFDDGDRPKTWYAPDVFVISVALPTDPPKLYGGSTDNGGGYTITMYYVMRRETRDILRRVTADGYNPSEEPSKSDPNKSMVNAVRLFDEWCRRAPSDDNWMARFKVVPQGNNLAEIGLPAWISNYNGKPFLIKRPGTTGFLYRHPDKSCMEFDVSLHPFPYLAKQGLCYMKDGFFKKILATLAFCIEGRSDDELPECLIGLFQLCYPNPVHAIQGEEFFVGKSPRSK